MYFDSHTHLNSEQLFDSYQEYLAEFELIWWKWLVNIAVDLDRAAKAVKIQKNNNSSVRLLSTVWFHPSLVANEDIHPSEFEKLIDLAQKFYKDNKEYIYAIWECGIDTHYASWEQFLPEQKKFFQMQCELAQDLDLPVVIHSRDDFESTFDVIKDFPDLKIYFHCWGYWPQEVAILQENFQNLWIWYTWNITFPKAENIRESFLETKEQNILMETDAPYLAPQPVRWKMNKPAYVSHIYQYCADMIDYDLDNYKNIIEDNFFSLYN